MPYSDLAKKHAAERRQQERNRHWVWNYLHNHPCVDCGESDIVVLEFDHVRGVKRQNVMRMVDRHASISSIEAEVAKCDVRCANCHRRATYARQPTAHRLTFEHDPRYDFSPRYPRNENNVMVKYTNEECLAAIDAYHASEGTGHHSFAAVGRHHNMSASYLSKLVKGQIRGDLATPRT